MTDFVGYSSFSFEFKFWINENYKKTVLNKGEAAFINVQKVLETLLHIEAHQ